MFWVVPDHIRGGLLPAGVARFLSPARLIVIRAGSEQDVLWATEEVLRAGAAGLVVGAPEKPLSLTMGRRLQLAAEAGRSMGIMLIREGAGSNAAETRWHCGAEPGDSTLQRWELKKNKAGTTGSWIVVWDEAARSVRMVSKAGERSLAAQTAE